MGKKLFQKRLDEYKTQADLMEAMASISALSNRQEIRLEALKLIVYLNEAMVLPDEEEKKKDDEVMD